MKVQKPWGYELIWAKTDDYVGKNIFINKGHRLSLQYHEKKEESILLIEGRLILQIEDDEITLTKGMSYHIPAKTIHRMTAVTDCNIIEVSTKELNDVIRIEDDYGREGKPDSTEYN